MADYPVGTIVYDPFGNSLVVKGVYWLNNIKYYYVQDANDFFFLQPNPICATQMVDQLGHIIPLPTPDCNCNGPLRLIPDSDLSLKVTPSQNNLYSKLR
jgi:hypothetical protein